MDSFIPGNSCHERLWGEGHRRRKWKIWSPERRFVSLPTALKIPLLFSCVKCLFSVIHFIASNASDSPKIPFYICSRKNSQLSVSIKQINVKMELKTQERFIIRLNKVCKKQQQNSQVNFLYSTFCSAFCLEAAIVSPRWARQKLQETCLDEVGEKPWTRLIWESPSSSGK